MFMRTTRSFVSRVVLPVVAMTMCLGLSACGDDQASADRSPITPTDDASAEPADEPTETELLSPEEEVKEELEAMLHDTVAALDDFYQNADEWHARATGKATDNASNEEADIELSFDRARMAYDAHAEFAESRIVFLNQEHRQIGESEVASFEIDSIDLGASTPVATGRACIDQSETSLETFDGEPIPDSEVPGQTWDITWKNIEPDKPVDGPSELEADWYITDADITANTPCSR